MHRCLLVQEIFSRICHCLRDFGGFHVGKYHTMQDVQEVRKTLAGLARTCQAFRDPALDALWIELDSLYPLLDCLPIDIHDKRDGSFRLIRALRPSDFAVFQKYARRVRCLGYGPHEQYTSRDLLRALSSFPSTPLCSLLPNLAYISWDGDSDELLPLIRFFAPPTLISLWLTGERWPQCKLAFISFLDIHFPKLQQLSCSDPSQEAMLRISEYICQAQNLTDIDVGIPNAAAMEHLMVSPTLRYLNIVIPNNNVWDRVQGEFQPSLMDFRLRAGRLDRVYEFMRLVKLGPRTVNFVLEGVTPAPLVVGFFGQLGKSLDHEMLQVLNYSINGISENTRANQYLYELEVHSLYPLVVFHNLVILRLEDFRMPMMNDDTAIKMAKAWPHLEVLKLGTGQDWQTDTGLLRRSESTMYGVGYIAHHCWKLHTLGLVFDPTKPHEKFKPEWANRNIQILDVGASPIDSPVPVAASLLFLTPNLRVIVSRPPLKNLSPGIGQMPVPDTRAQNWGMVLEMVHMFSGLKAAAIAEAKALIFDEFERETDALRRRALAKGSAKEKQK